jgi:hypothetical protein
MLLVAGQQLLLLLLLLVHLVISLTANTLTNSDDLAPLVARQQLLHDVVTCSAAQRRAAHNHCECFTPPV